MEYLKTWYKWINDKHMMYQNKYEVKRVWYTPFDIKTTLLKTRVFQQFVYKSIYDNKFSISLAYFGDIYITF